MKFQSSEAAWSSRVSVSPVGVSLSASGYFSVSGDLLVCRSLWRGCCLHLAGKGQDTVKRHAVHWTSHNRELSSPKPVVLLLINPLLGQYQHQKGESYREIRTLQLFKGSAFRTQHIHVSKLLKSRERTA